MIVEPVQYQSSEPPKLSFFDRDEREAKQSAEELRAWARQKAPFKTLAAWSRRATRLEIAAEIEPCGREPRCGPHGHKRITARAFLAEPRCRHWPNPEVPLMTCECGALGERRLG